MGRKRSQRSMNMSWPNCVEALRGGRGKGCIDEVLGGKESSAIFFKDAAELRSCP